MVDQKLYRLQSFLQDHANTAWDFTMNAHRSKYSRSTRNFGETFEFMLQGSDHDLSILLNDIANEHLKEQNSTPDPPDFSQYVRYSRAGYKEVFIGDKWVVVPADACIDFRASSFGTTNGFSVSISSGSNYATLSSTESLSSFQENERSEGEQLHVELQDNYVSEEEFNWMHLAGQVYHTAEKHITTLDDVGAVYRKIPKEFKRTFAYKISKVAKNVSKSANAGKIFQGAEKLAEKAKVLGEIGAFLTFGTIVYEATTDTWDAHTVVAGTLLVVGITASFFGAPVVVVGIAIYGILDYAFDISEGIDNHFGRNSGFWDENPIRSFPVDRNPLFKEVKIDKTSVAPSFRMPPKLKN